MLRPLTSDCTVAAISSSPPAYEPYEPPAPVTPVMPPGCWPVLSLSHDPTSPKAPTASAPTSASDPSQRKLFHVLVLFSTSPSFQSSTLRWRVVIAAVRATWDAA